MTVDIRMSRNGKWLLVFPHNMEYVYDSIEELVAHLQSLLESELRVALLPTIEPEQKK